MRKPFWHKSNKCFYVKDNHGRFVRLDPDETTAYEIWEQMRAAGASIAHPSVRFSALVSGWLEEYQHAEVNASRFELIGNYLGQFIDWTDDKIAADISVDLVRRWLKEPKQNHKGRKSAKVWSVATQRDAAHAVKRVLSWASEQGYIKRNPIASLRLKTPKGRVRTISDVEHAALVAASRAQKRNGKQFALYLIASHCGARPQQIRDVTKEHVHHSGHMWTFTEHKTAAATGRPLNVYLSPCLQTVTKILAANRSSGPLFTQDSGKPWKKDTIVQRFSRLRKQLGLEDVVAYAYRHTFATNALLAEVPLATVSALLGHTDTRMVSQVYGHLDQHAPHLAEAAAKVAKKRLG